MLKTQICVCSFKGLYQRKMLLEKMVGAFLQELTVVVNNEEQMFSDKSPLLLCHILNYYSSAVKYLI